MINLRIQEDRNQMMGLGCKNIIICICSMFYSCILCIFFPLFVSNRKSGKISYYHNSYNLKNNKRFHVQPFHKLCKSCNCILNSIFLLFFSARNWCKIDKSSMEQIFSTGKNRYGKLLCMFGRRENCILYRTGHLSSSSCSHYRTNDRNISCWNNVFVGRWSSRSFKKQIY